MASQKGNKKVAKNRGKEWQKKLVIGKHVAQTNPTMLRVKRCEKGIAQESIAKLVGLSLSTYGQIERGNRLVKESRAEAIANALTAHMLVIFKKDNNKYVAR